MSGDTIFALATAQGRAGVAVVRISGAQAFDVARALCGKIPNGHEPALRTLVDQHSVAIDRALVLRFDSPASFTGEDTVEFHLHGSVAVVAAVLRTLGSGTGRLAEPGEFTRRALENNKMDLAQVEALGDLIEAETEAQRQQAFHGMSGSLSERIEQWRANLIRGAALIEATIDFADEDVPLDVTSEVNALLLSVRLDIEDQLQGFKAAERVRNGFIVAIVGPPNAGKSTLLNALAQRNAAIVSETAGTTRDIIEVRMDLAGIPVTVLDTAGLRLGAEEVEKVGIHRAIDRASDADLRIFLAEPGTDLPVKRAAGDIAVAPKADCRTDDVVAVSGKTGLGMRALVDVVTQELAKRVSSAGLISHERHRVAMEKSLVMLAAAVQHVELGPEFYDIAAEEIRASVRSLEAVIGRVDVENLLDEIFSSFCLGK